jgi:catechol 2,3-dioxygenase-like lactoylglutathione lyase family enzyme
MASVRVTGTNHTSFTVRSLDRAIALFRDGLGFELLSRAPRDPEAIAAITGVPGADVTIAFLQGPSHRVELIEYHAPADRGSSAPRPCDAGFAHLALDVADMDAALAVAAKHGLGLLGAVYVIDQGPNAGRRVAYFRDDNGLTLEFLEAKA